jgi:rhodanese-related sulfurtransferase
MVEQISPQEYSQRRDRGELWQLLDVRENWETELAPVGGAVRIPQAEIAARLAELDRSVPVAVLCHAGVRSDRVADFLDSQGFNRVANIVGGTDAWSQTVDASVPRY